MPRLAPALLAAALLGSPPLLAAGAEPAFPPAALRAHVGFLADPLLEGRQSGRRGHDLAARYVATRFQSMGLTAPVDGGWMQRVPLVSAKLASPKAGVLHIGSRAFRHGEDVYIPASVVSANLGFSADVVFAGYCLHSPDEGIDDFAGLDVRGRIVACLGGFPKGMPSDIGAHLSSRRALMVQEHGGIAVLGLRTAQTEKVYPWARVIEHLDEPSTTFVQDDGTPFLVAPKIRSNVFLNTPAAEALFAGAPRTLADVLAEADRQGGRPRGFALPTKVRYEIGSVTERFESANVLGLLPGSDPALAKEVVILVAHLDHLGDKGGIHPGALDNAAGVATLLEVARAFAESPARPRRSVLFAAVTGEEMGLLGSRYLSRHPVPATAAPVAVVCLDAPILLYDFTDVIAFGQEHSTLGPAIARAVARAGVASSPDPMPEQGIFTRSDHYSFVKEGVPGVFLVTGWANGGQKAFSEYLRTHYHRPSDNLELPIDWNAAAKFARINHLIAREIADTPARPLWYEGNLFGKTYAPNAPRAKR